VQFRFAVGKSSRQQHESSISLTSPTISISSIHPIWQ
jgi:hypothetical protein